MKEGFVYAYLAGVEYTGFREIPFVPLGRWLMGLSLILFITGIWLGKKRNILVFEMVRFGGRRRWWDMQFWTLFFMGAVGCLFYEFLIQGLDFLLGLPKPEGLEEVLIGLLWMVHIMTLESLFCLLDITTFRKTAPAFLFVTEVSTFAAGFLCRKAAKYMFGNWGMYMQSVRVEDNYGFSPAAVLLLECLIIAVVWRIGAALLSRRDDL